MLEDLQERIEKFFDTHCFIFFHDWLEIEPEFPSGFPSSERWYWKYEQCQRCKQKRISMKDEYLQ